MNVRDAGVIGLTDGRLSPVLCTAWVYGSMIVFCTHDLNTMCGYIYMCSVHGIVTMCDYICVCSIHGVVAMCECFNVSKIHIIIPGCA